VANKFSIATVFSAIDKMTGPLGKIGDKADAVGKKVAGVGKAMGQAFKIGAQAAAVAGTAVIAAGVAIGKMALDMSTAGDEIAKTSRAIGMSAKSLQEFRYVGERSGVSVDEMTTALQKLTINLGKGSEGTQRALAMIGVSAEQLRAAGPDQSLAVIAEGFKSINDPAAKAAAATELFGKRGIGMINVLSEGQDGISKLAAEANRLGYVMDDVMLDNSEALNDTMLNLQTSLKGLGNQMAGGFMPVLNSAVSKLTEFFVAMGPQIKKFGQRFTQLGERVLDIFLNIMPTLMDFVTDTLDALMPLVDDIIPVIADFFKQIAPIAVRLVKALMPAIQVVIRSISRLVEGGLKIIGPIFEMLVPIIETVVNSLSIGLGGAFVGIGTVIDALTPVVIILGMALSGLGQVLAIVGDTVATIMGSLGAGVAGIKEFFSGEFDYIRGLAIYQASMDKAAAASPFATGETAARVTDWGALMQQSAMQNFASKTDYEAFMQNRSTNPAAVQPATPQAPVAPATPISSSTTTTNTSTLDVNFNNPPPGTAIRLNGQAPGFNVNMGAARSR
jgi:phage-related protein